ncbi:hypothetical protein [Helicobacter bilis]|uniref:hypothetical protein n=1 Tax=Helicobacter bilis TaxID=37372 RepID=UPI001E56F63C|nr:hypothetical protein [Helicobacter bilis]
MKHTSKLIQEKAKYEILMGYLQELKEKKKNSVKKVRKNSTTFKEIVLNIDKHHTIKDIEIAYKKVQEAIPKLQEANFINVAIHRDEGHFNKITDEPVVNYHAHLLLNNLDKNNKTIFRQLTRAELSKIQDIMAESLQMERGARNSNNKHKTKWQLEHEKNKHINKIRELLPQVENELKKDKERDTEQQQYYTDFIEWYIIDRKMRNIDYMRKSLHDKYKNNTLHEYLEKYDNTALVDYKVHLRLLEKEKQAEQEKADMSLEQKQQQGIMQPEITAEYYINELFFKNWGNSNKSKFNTRSQAKKAKAIYTNIYNYSKKLKDTDPTTYEKVSKILFCKDPIEYTLDRIKEIERSQSIEK